MLETLLGGLLALVGGYVAIRYQLQNVRKFLKSEGLIRQYPRLGPGSTSPLSLGPFE